MSITTLAKSITNRIRRVFFWLPSSTPVEEHKIEMGHDHALVIAVTAPERLPRLRQFRYALRVFTPLERKIIAIASVVAILSLGVAAISYSHARIVLVPVTGGSLTEALVGQPKYLNPFDAISNDVDRDLVRLIYSGLFRYDGMDVVPDLAEEATWSDDLKTFTVKIKKDARFHDGQPVTAEDVRFTYDAVLDPARKSPLAPAYRGLKVSITDDSTVVFALDRPDASLLTKLTLGILPAHLWQDIPAQNARLSDLNIKPIGSGPYRVKSFLRDNVGNIHSYTLERWDRYSGVKPYLNTIDFQFFADSRQALDAYKGGQVDSLAFVSTSDSAKLAPIQRQQDLRLELPEETIAFLNLKDKTLADKNVRQALTLAVNRQEEVDALSGAAQIVTGPYPFGEVSSTTPSLDQARTLLDKAGWVIPKDGNIRVWSPAKPPASPAAAKKDKTPAPTPTSTSAESPSAASSTELALTITVADEPDLLTIADTLKRQWSILGVHVIIDAKSTEDVMRKATRERKAQIVLLNVYLGPDQDAYPFWWSGQAIDRGLNISNLTDRSVDDALDKARSATSSAALHQAQADVSAAVLNDLPAIFLVRPTHHYLLSDKIKGAIGPFILAQPAERFQNIANWYLKTGWRWK